MEGRGEKLERIIQRRKDDERTLREGRRINANGKETNSDDQRKDTKLKA